MRSPNIKFTTAVRRAVARTSDHGPDIGTWLARVHAINDPRLTEAIEGIWCGRSGEVKLDLPDSSSLLCMGWYNGRVEWSYLS